MLKPYQIHTLIRTNKLVCKGKDESGAKVDTAESRVEVDIEFNNSFRKRKSPYSDSEECISNLKWDNCSKQFSSITTGGLEQLMLPEEIRQTENTIAGLKKKCRNVVGNIFPAKKKLLVLA